MSSEASQIVMNPAKKKRLLYAQSWLRESVSQYRNLYQIVSTIGPQIHMSHGVKPLSILLPSELAYPEISSTYAKDLCGAHTPKQPQFPSHQNPSSTGINQVMLTINFQHVAFVLSELQKGINLVESQLTTLCCQFVTSRVPPAALFKGQKRLNSFEGANSLA